MRIAIADNNSLKFIKDLKEHWEGVGHEIKMQHPDHSKHHEVRYEQGSSEFLAQWADIYYIDTWDNNLSYLYKLYNGQADPENYPAGWDNNRKPMIVVRALDWEVWLGHARDQKVIDWVDKVICIAPYIEAKLRSEGDWGNKLKLIRPGVNLDKFTLKTKQTDGFQLGMVLGDMWVYKNHMGGLDIFTTLYRQDPRWRLHIRGQFENQTYDPINWNHYLESREIKNVVTLYPHQEDMNQWYENIDILLHPGMKEAFCYAVAEAMAKGIPAVVNDFYGSQDIWEGLVGLYQTHNEAIKLFEQKDKFVPEQVRRALSEKYSLERQLKETDEYLGL